MTRASLPEEFKLDEVKTELWDNSKMRLNVDHDFLLDNIRQNIHRPVPQMMPHQTNGQHIAIVGGGWSLTDPKVYEELRALHFSGVPLVAVNNSANWLMERNLRPAMHIMLDARAENLYMIEKPIPRCKYFLASQCHPSLFDACADREAYIFHVVADDSDSEKEEFDRRYFKRWQPVPSGGTVGITAIMVLRLLGFQFQHLFGLDSCYRKSDQKHHAYDQPLNDKEGAAPFIVADKTFWCSAWQAAQAKNFKDLIDGQGQNLQLAVYGDGLLAHMLKTGAALADEADAQA